MPPLLELGKNILACGFSKPKNQSEIFEKQKKKKKIIKELRIEEDTVRSLSFNSNGEDFSAFFRYITVNDFLDRKSKNSPKHLARNDFSTSLTGGCTEVITIELLYVDKADKVLTKKCVLKKSKDATKYDAQKTPEEQEKSNKRRKLRHDANKEHLSTFLRALAKASDHHLLCQVGERRLEDQGMVTVDGVEYLLDAKFGEDAYEFFHMSRKPRDKVNQFRTQLGQQLKVLHDKGIVHYDLKLENILVEDGQEGLQIQLFDFDYARNFKNPSLNIEEGAQLGTRAGIYSGNWLKTSLSGSRSDIGFGKYERVNDMWAYLNTLSDLSLRTMHDDMETLNAVNSALNILKEQSHNITARTPPVEVVRGLKSLDSLGFGEVENIDVLVRFCGSFDRSWKEKERIKNAFTYYRMYHYLQSQNISPGINKESFVPFTDQEKQEIKEAFLGVVANHPSYTQGADIHKTVAAICNADIDPHAREIEEITKVIKNKRIGMSDADLEKIRAFIRENPGTQNTLYAQIGKDGLLSDRGEVLLQLIESSVKLTSHLKSRWTFRVSGGHKGRRADVKNALHEII